MAHVSAAERRPQLIKAAIDLMSREGVAAGSTRAIAAELGVAQATVHYTFGTKEGLYRAVLEQLTENLVRQVERAAPEEAGFEETISTLAAALWRTVREQPSSHRMLTELTTFAMRSSQLSEVLTSHYQGLIDVTARILRQAAERTGQPLAQPAEAIAWWVLASFDGLTNMYLSLPDEETERVALHGFVSSVVALAGGRLDRVAAPRHTTETSPTG